MRQNLFTICVVALAVSAGLCFAADSQPAAAPGPKIQVDKVTHDYGTFWAAGPLTHAFKITNAGSELLKITAVRPACGCTTVGSYPNELKPGDSGELSFSLNATALHGRFDKTIAVSSNDPTTPTLILHLVGECRRQVEVLPQYLFFGRVMEQTPQTRSVDITSGTEAELKLQLDTPADGLFRFELVEVTPGKKYQLKATLNPPFPKGLLRGTARLTTNIDAQKTLTVDVTGIVPERIEVQPTMAMVPAAPQGVQPAGQAVASQAAAGTPSTQPATSYQTTQVMLLNNGSAPLVLKEALADDPKIAVIASESQAPRGYRVEIRVPSDYQMPPAGRYVVLRLEDSEKPVIVVPVRSTPTYQPPLPAGPTAQQLIGTPAPDFTMMTASGRSVSKAAQAGKITVLDFFAPTCPHCKKQMPRLEALRKAYEAQGVNFVYVSGTMGGKVWTPNEVSGVLKDLSVAGDFALDPGNALGRKFAATSYPTLVVIGKDGKIAAITPGNKANLEDLVKGQLDPLLGKAPTASQPAAAQTSAR